MGKSEVRFAQKGLFQHDVTVHHALLTAALTSYTEAAPNNLLGKPLGVPMNDAS